uniref:Starch synthase, chloroplastic/amyloplastic n=1 Tax=Pyramimonas obovata TaxID=1411642 RepID=A0A7S0WI69_9CHLO|mmetsp:Transcript_26194/g.56827  ORF Transcript_26194/g.56827 Transcript_26194/m.56827 type:complete len:583 (+) Transcript_26194:112-1860(+)
MSAWCRVAPRLESFHTERRSASAPKSRITAIGRTDNRRCRAPKQQLSITKLWSTGVKSIRTTRQRASHVDYSPPSTSASLAGENATNVILVGSEVAPWSKTGGLGDVMGSLPKALAARGHRVMVVAPRYRNYAEAFDTSIRKAFPIFGGDHEVGYFHAYLDGVDFVFVDHPSFHHVGDDIYSGDRASQHFRFALLSRAALEAAWHVPCGGCPYGDHNTVFVANDWQAALVPVYLQAYYRDHGKMLGARAIQVVHNMAHQGRGPAEELDGLFIPDHYRGHFMLDDPIGGEHMNILKAGLAVAHRIVAVSHGYAWEIQTDMGGWGLAPLLRDQSWKVRGIVNGIDYDEWNPEIDEHIQTDGYETFTASKEGLNGGKAACKAALQRELGLPENPDVPLMGFIGRLDAQKGCDQIFEAAGWLLSQDVQLVMLGTGREDYEASMRDMENNHKDKCRAWVGFSVKMAHRINASCDILLMPSRFEPCGLNQLYAMRYGTVPVVHAVGGLRDTVEPYNPYENTGTGWNYEGAETNNLISAINNATNTYRQHYDAFQDMQLRGMAKDFTWNLAAELYEKAIVDAKFDDYRG